MKTTNIICNTCGRSVPKNKNEINRQIKNGRTEFYCGLECYGKNKHNLKHLKKFHDKFVNTKYIRQPDQYSNFRWYIKSIKKSNKGYDIDCEYLKKLWEEQNGICPITKQKLELRTHSYKNKSHPYSASLDRIDNNKGYIKGNVRFVSLMFNYARNTFTDEDVVDFCHKVVNNHEILEKSSKEI